MMKQNSIQKIASTILVAILLFGCTAGVFVTNAEAITPRWASILSIDLMMVFDGNEGTASGAARKQSTATKIEGTVYVYKQVGNTWIYVDEWYASKTRGTLGVSGTFVAESGVTYKAVFVVTAYTGTTPETETVEYIKTCP